MSDALTAAGIQPLPHHAGRIDLNSIRPGVRLRLGQVDQDHLNALVTSNGQWPPIVVRDDDHSIVDGHYRYLAALQLGHTQIDCVYFTGEEDTAFLEALRRNRSHGLPLSRDEREAAVQRVLNIYPDWSDRRVASACCVAPATVARIRTTLEPPSQGEIHRLRVGRDGRLRPADPKASRERILSALQSRPEGSLREIARIAGASPATVRSVKANLDAHGGPPASELEPTVTGISPPSSWQVDTALIASLDAQEFITWFDGTSMRDQWRDFVDRIPISRVYEVADEARKRAASWLEFASLVEERVRRPHAVCNS
jgi:ParB-like chromosome segregation protein Spo0J